MSGTSDYYSLFSDYLTNQKGADFVGWYVEGTLFEGSYLRVLGDMTVTAVYSGFETHTITLVDSDTGETYRDLRSFRAGNWKLTSRTCPCRPIVREWCLWAAPVYGQETDGSREHAVVNEDMVITAAV